MTAYRSASSHDTLGGETATVRGSAYSKLSGGKACEVPMVWDSGCTKDIVSEEVVSALGAHISKLNWPLTIVTASRDCLNILGTSNIFI